MITISSFFTRYQRFLMLILQQMNYFIFNQDSLLLGWFISSWSSFIIVVNEFVVTLLHVDLRKSAELIKIAICQRKSRIKAMNFC